MGKKQRSIGDRVITTLLGLSAANVLIMVLGPHSLVWLVLSLLLGFIAIVLALAPIMQNRKWFVIVVSNILRDRTPVELIDHEGDTRYSIARYGHDGRLVAPVYWFNNIGECILEDNGRVDPASDSSYVYFWLPLRRADRAMHALRNDVPDFDQLDGLYKSERRAILKEAYDGDHK
jgi:hypothetical protein